MGSGGGQEGVRRGALAIVLHEDTVDPRLPIRHRQLRLRRHRPLLEHVHVEGATVLAHGCAARRFEGVVCLIFARKDARI
eukprot:1111012-Prorocentrum_minimum.AAC.1